MTNIDPSRPFPTLPDPSGRFYIVTHILYILSANNRYSTAEFEHGLVMGTGAASEVGAGTGAASEVGGGTGAASEVEAGTGAEAAALFVDTSAAVPWLFEYCREAFADWMQIARDEAIRPDKDKPSGDKSGAAEISRECSVNVNDSVNVKDWDDSVNEGAARRLTYV
jgi:hypothetical protein